MDGPPSKRVFLIVCCGDLLLDHSDEGEMVIRMLIQRHCHEVAKLSAGLISEVQFTSPLPVGLCDGLFD